MLTDRLAERATVKTLHLFSGSHAPPAGQWAQARAAHLQRAREPGARLGS